MFNLFKHNEMNTYYLVTDTTTIPNQTMYLIWMTDEPGYRVSNDINEAIRFIDASKASEVARIANKIGKNTFSTQMVKEPFESTRKYL